MRWLANLLKLLLLFAPLPVYLVAQQGLLHEAAARGDVAELTKTVQDQLTAKNMKFNTVDPLPFRDKLKAAGFYDEWKKKFGDAAWAIALGAGLLLVAGAFGFVIVARSLVAAE